MKVSYQEVGEVLSRIYSTIFCIELLNIYYFKASHCEYKTVWSQENDRLVWENLWLTHTKLFQGLKKCWYR